MYGARIALGECELPPGEWEWEWKREQSLSQWSRCGTMGHRRERRLTECNGCARRDWDCTVGPTEVALGSPQLQNRVAYQHAMMQSQCIHVRRLNPPRATRTTCRAFGARDTSIGANSCVRRQHEMWRAAATAHLFIRLLEVARPLRSAGNDKSRTKLADLDAGGK